jgi:uncharacterized coiled-coil DUF342 family protein
MEDEEIARLTKRSEELIQQSKELIEKSQAVINGSRTLKELAGRVKAKRQKGHVGES